MAATVHFLMILSAAFATALASRMSVHYFQLESYQFPGYFRTVKRNPVRILLPGVILAAVTGILFGIAEGMGGRVGPFTWLLITLVACGLVVLCGWILRKTMTVRKAKKPLGVTGRVKRLWGIMVVVNALVGWLFSRIGAVFILLMPLLLPGLVALAGLVAWPVEKGISELYFRDARQRLRDRPDLIKIGITGSYGKTSVKFILATMLAEKYQVLATPGSFNTPMGVTRIVRSRLRPGHQIFLAEMGARHVGDIKELCRLVEPQMGIITSVGPQHLDPFKTLDRISGTKYELIEALPQDGTAFFPNDGSLCSGMYDRTEKEKYLSSLKADERADVWAEQVRVTASGSSFRLCTRLGSVDCTTCLLGEHNISNILLCAAVCLKLGLSLKQIARGIAAVQPVEHRLQLLPGTVYTVIDDAFNSNPAGADRALEVLRAFEGGKRIIITPGMVELGDKEAEFNREFGRHMARCADIAILVGPKHTAPIAEGLAENGFPAESIHTAASLREANEILARLAGQGDVVLYENDLPDNYSENG